MPTFVGALRLRLSLPESGSLKEKRRSIKSVLAHLANELHVAAAEVGDLDRWQSAELAVACVANSRRHADEVTARAIEFDSNPEVLSCTHCSRDSRMSWATLPV